MDDDIKEIRIFSRDEKKQDEMRSKYSNEKYDTEIEISSSDFAKLVKKETDYLNLYFKKRMKIKGNLMLAQKLNNLIKLL